MTHRRLVAAVVVLSTLLGAASVPVAAAGPTASFEYDPTTPAVGETVTFDASASTDGDGSVVSYEWDFDGDGSVDAQSSNPVVRHSYGGSGDRTVTLTVTDDDGTTDQTSKTLTVADPNSDPTAEFEYTPSDPERGETVTFDASASTDDDGSVVAYEWDFGDGAATRTTAPTVTHEYAAGGDYTVALTVVDDDGASATASATVPVNAPPTASISSTDAGDRVVAFESDASDPDGAVASYEWRVDGEVVSTAQSSRHAFESAGDHDVTLRVADDDGATATARTVVRVDASVDSTAATAARTERRAETGAGTPAAGTVATATQGPSAPAVGRPTLGLLAGFLVLLVAVAVAARRSR